MEGSGRRDKRRGHRCAHTKLWAHVSCAHTCPHVCVCLLSSRVCGTHLCVHVCAGPAQVGSKHCESYKCQEFAGHMCSCLHTRTHTALVLMFTPHLCTHTRVPCPVTPVMCTHVCSPFHDPIFVRRYVPNHRVCRDRWVCSRFTHTWIGVQLGPGCCP